MKKAINEVCGDENLTPISYWTYEEILKGDFSLLRNKFCKEFNLQIVEHKPKKSLWIIEDDAKRHPEGISYYLDSFMDSTDTYRLTVVYGRYDYEQNYYENYSVLYSYAIYFIIVEKGETSWEFSGREIAQLINPPKSISHSGWSILGKFSSVGWELFNIEFLKKLVILGKFKTFFSDMKYGNRTHCDC